MAANLLNLGRNVAILRHACTCSLVSSERYLFLIMLRVEKADLQLKVEPNIVNEHNALLVSAENLAFGTSCSQKVAG